MKTTGRIHKCRGPKGSPVSAGFPEQSRRLYATMVAYIDYGVAESPGSSGPSSSAREEFLASFTAGRVNNGGAQAVGLIANNPRVLTHSEITAIGCAYHSRYFFVPLHILRVLLHMSPHTTPRIATYHSTCVEYHSNRFKYSETCSASRTFIHMTP
jgi:hypothetical protein